MTLDLDTQLVLPGQLAIPETGAEDVPRFPTVLVADCPWQPRDKLPGKRGAAAKYDTMAVEDLCALRIPDVGPRAVLFLWRLASMQEEALRVVRAWGFDLKSEITWVKLTKSGKHAFNLGHYTRQCHEVCLIATRGSALPEVHDVRSVFEARAGRHSEKPSAFYRLVERMYPNSEKVELFARVARKGWTTLGNQVEGGSSETIPFGLFAREST